MGELLEMSQKELDRYHILKKVASRELTQSQGAKLLSIKERQVRNLLTAMKRNGAEGLVSKRRGRPGNHRKSETFKQQILEAIGEHYEGFGPTFAAEKIEERQGWSVNAETLRLWMIDTHIWVPRKQRTVIHSPRQRRACFGELIQADGSHHRWFGDDGPMVNLCVFIDDATSTITGLRFSAAETLDSYFETLEQHLKRYGRFRALYVDKASMFRGKHGMTHMQRALKTLDIELILANSPQAKGRVERANRTLQDRLLKELKLREIKTIEQANEFLPEFIESSNEKFSKKPMSEFDAHRPLEGYDLERVLSRYETRTLLSSAIFQFNNTMYQVQGISELRRLKGKEVEVRVTANGTMRVFLGNREIRVIPLSEVLEEARPVELSHKEVVCWEFQRKRRPVPVSHPWKADYHRDMMRQKFG